MAGELRMSRELLVVLPHSLGREEARRRVKSAIDHAQAGLGQGIVNTSLAWPQPDRADVRVAALGHTVAAEIDVDDSNVRVRVLLPWLLAGLASKITQRIEQAGTTLRLGHDRKGGGPGGA